MYRNAIDEINQSQRGRGQNSADRLRRDHETAETARAATSRSCERSFSATRFAADDRLSVVLLLARLA